VTGIPIAVAPFTEADQAVGLVTVKPMRQASDLVTSLPSTPPKNPGSWIRLTPPEEVWIAPRSMIASSYPVALAPMTLRCTSPRPAGLYQPAVASATRAT
jgi:hypothetical protein